MTQTIGALCHAARQDDGTVTITVTIDGLDVDQAARLAAALREPLRAIIGGVALEQKPRVQ